ncbi:hypothetical protein MRX96_008688 [Rhipicephalus microplus]
MPMQSLRPFSNVDSEVPATPKPFADSIHGSKPASSFCCFSAMVDALPVVGLTSTPMYPTWVSLSVQRR